VEIDRFKDAWQKQPVSPQFFSSGASISRPFVFLRATAIREREKADEVARLVFAFFFAVAVAGASLVLMQPGPALAGTLLLAAAVLVDGVGGAILLSGRSRDRAGASMRDFVHRETRNLERRLRFDRSSYRAMAVMFCLSLVLFLWQQDGDPRAQALSTLGKTAVLTAFLAFAWWRARSRPKEQHQELDRCLKELSE